MSKIEDSRDRDGALTWELKPAFRWTSLLFLVWLWLIPAFLFRGTRSEMHLNWPILWLFGLVWGCFTLSLLVNFVWSSPARRVKVRPGDLSDMEIETSWSLQPRIGPEQIVELVRGGARCWSAMRRVRGSGDS